MLSYQAGQLCIEGSPVGSLADRAGTPVFLFSEARLRANYGALARGLAHSGVKARVRYCAKANNEAAVLAVLASCGSHIVVSHPAEAQLALRCGFLPERIAYQRPVIDEGEIRELVAAGVDFFHAYRLRDLDILDKVASEFHKTVRVSLRIGGIASRLSPLTFLSRRLGFRTPELLPAAQRTRDFGSLRLVAINFYAGTQQEDVSDYRPLLRKVARLAAEIQARVGVTLEEINVGGGIPSPSLRRIGVSRLRRRVEDDVAAQDSPRLLETFARSLGVQFREAAGLAGLRPVPGISAEPGRSIAGNAAILVARVRAIQGNWVFLDASRNYLPESSLVFARTVLPATDRGRERQRYYHFSGSTLNTLDVIDLWRRLPALREGDLVAFCDAGAYSIARASRYAGLSPAVYLLGADGSVRMVRRPETLADLTAAMVETPRVPSRGDGRG